VPYVTEEEEINNHRSLHSLMTILRLRIERHVAVILRLCLSLRLGLRGVHLCLHGLTLHRLPRNEHRGDRYAVLLVLLRLRLLIDAGLQNVGVLLTVRVWKVKIGRGHGSRRWIWRGCRLGEIWVR